MSVDPEQGTPDPGNSPAPEAQPAAAPDPFEPRYKETQAAFTKSQQELAAERQVWESEEAVLARMQQQFPHWFDEDELNEPAGAPDPNAPPADARVDALYEWAQAEAAQKAQEKGAREFAADLAEELGVDEQQQPVELGELGKQYVEMRTMALGGNREALTAAVKEWTVANPASAAPAADPRVPHVPTGGPAGGGQKDPADMTPRERQQFMADRLRADA